MFHQVIKTNGTRGCVWVLYLKYTGQCSWDLQYCFMHLHSCYKPCKAKTWLFSHLQKDAEAEHLHWLLCTGIPSKVQGASHSLSLLLTPLPGAVCCCQFSSTPRPRQPVLPAASYTVKATVMQRKKGHGMCQNL